MAASRHLTSYLLFVVHWATLRASMLEFWENLSQPWQRVSRPALIAWAAFYLLFLIYAATSSSGFLLIDNVNLVVHEGGHLLFGWLGPTASLWGGTLLQWLVPALLACHFFVQRQTTAFAFCVFMFFENFLYTATYMADARAQVLPLVSVGEGNGGHDWASIFSSLGVIQYDTRIAGVVRVMGWLGMVGTVLWLVCRARSAEQV